MQGPSIDHKRLHEKLKTEETKLKQIAAHVNNFLTTIERAKAAGTALDDQVVNQLTSLTDTVRQLVRNNEEIVDFMRQELFGLSKYQAVMLREGDPTELARLEPLLKKNFRVGRLGKKPKEDLVEEMGKSTTINISKTSMISNAVQAQVRSNKMNYQELLGKLEEAREILRRQFNVNESPATPRRYQADNI